MFQRWLTKILNSPAGVTAGIVFLLGVGLALSLSLQVDLFPPLNFPTLNIITEIPSFSSLEMEKQVSLPLESAANGVLGVSRVRSTSATGISMVSVDFRWGTDMLMARQLLQEALAGVRGQLPPDASISIENLSTTLSFIEGYSLSGLNDLVQLRNSAELDLKPRLQGVPGVYKVLVMGGQRREYSVRLNPLLMLKYDLALSEVEDALAKNNMQGSPGVVNQYAQELVFHTNGSFANESEIGSMVVAVKEGSPVRLKDIARVERGTVYERGDTSQDGQPSVLVQIYKQPSFDTESVARGVAQEVARFANSLPQGGRITNYYDQAQLVHDSIGSVKESVWVGALLVVLVLLAFLRNWKSTLIASLSIPLSVLAAIAVMRLLGIGLNIMSLGGLAIGTGIIVDDTIVVLENCFRWLGDPKLRGKMSVQEVVVKASQEVLRPVVVSTLTNVGIFLPMIFVAGFAGRLFAPVSWTVTFCLLASLAVALSVIPFLTSRWLKAIKQVEKEDWLHRAYQRLLNLTLKRPLPVLGLCLFPLLAVALLVRGLPSAFLPDLDEGALLVSATLPAGASLAEASRVSGKLEQSFQQVPGVQVVVRRTGHAEGAEDTDNVNHSDIMLKLLPKSQRPLDLQDLVNALQSKTDSLPSVQVNYLMPLADKINDALGGVAADLGIDLYGPDLDVLGQKADALMQSLKSLPGIAELIPPANLPSPSLEIQVNKDQTGSLGIAQKDIFDSLTAFSSGLVATNVREVQREIPVTLHFAEAGKNMNWEELRSLPLRTAGASHVPLEQVAQLGYGQVPSQILHENLSRKLTLMANLKGRRAQDVVKDVEAALQKLGLPRSYSWGFSGKYQTQTQALQNMLLVLLMAIGVVALILWLEFRSFAEVLLILLTIPLAAVGALLGLWAFGQSLNVSSMIGAVLLVGIVVRNGIMLLDMCNQHLNAGDDLPQAIQHAARKRLRPILMTAAVTMLGMLPLAIGWGTGSELQRPLAIAVVGGIFTSTLLTLAVLPAASSLLLRHKAAKKK